jgi:hypothetical protein
MGSHCHRFSGFSSVSSQPFLSSAAAAIIQKRGRQESARTDRSQSTELFSEGAGLCIASGTVSSESPRLFHIEKVRVYKFTKPITPNDIPFSETTPGNRQKADRDLPSTHGALRFTTLLRCPLQRNRLTISLPLSRYHQPNVLRLGPSHFLSPVPVQTRALRFPNPIPLVHASPIITNVRSASADVYCRPPASMRG